MSSFYRRSYDHVVTVSMPCKVCSALVSEGDLKPKTDYVYGEGYLRTTETCPACHAKMKADMQARVKDLPNIWG